MKRLYLTVEGQTEQAFSIDVLQPHLAGRNVFVSKPRLTGLYARRRARIPKGGLLNTFKHSLGDIQRWLREDKSLDARFSMMIDMYSLPDDCPGYSAARALIDPYQRVETLEQELAKVVDDPRFIPYVQLHEFEALVLSDAARFSHWFDSSGSQVKALREECERFDSPELIDDGEQTHPKARIRKHFVDYDENIDGPLLAKDMGLELMREKCPHFNKWLTALEQLDAMAVTR